MCILFSILQATFIFKPWRRQETTSAKNVRTLLQKAFFQTKQTTVMMLEFIRRELLTSSKPWLLFSILRQGLKLVPTNKKCPGPVFRMWARRQHSKRRNPAKFNLFNIYLICSKTSWPRNYISNVEKPLDIKKPPPSLAEYAGVTTRERKENIRELENILKHW